MGRGATWNVVRTLALPGAQLGAQQASPQLPILVSHLVPDRAAAREQDTLFPSRTQETLYVNSRGLVIDKLVPLIKGKFPFSSSIC